MKKTVFVGLLSVSILAEIHATEKKEINQNKTHSLKIPDKVPSGIIKEYYENGKIRSSISYRGDEKHGLRKEFYETGKLLLKVPYHHTLFHGVMELYYPSGKLQLEIPFKNNTVDGMMKAYYSTGKLHYETPFILGKKKGIGKVYNPTGKPKIALFHNANYNDVIKVYSENNTLLLEIIIEDGKVINTP
ncbi:MAG: hypothetical protein U9O64_09395 [Campylobacterota bacterium]|nr:hypothetical protein [Campylobacterota bacterium]